MIMSEYFRKKRKADILGHNNDRGTPHVKGCSYVLFSSKEFYEYGVIDTFF